MGKAGWFLLGFLISSFVSCFVCYLAGRAVIVEYRELYAKLHSDVLAVVRQATGVKDTIEAKASAIGKVITG